MEMENNLTNTYKYIIYLTTNIINKKIYVGIHKTQHPYDFDKYLGCGVTTNRPSSYEKAKTPFQYAVKKYGVKNFIRKTLIVFDTLEEALKMEALIVNEDFIRRDDTYNVALGGGSLVDTSIELYQYDFDGMFIKSWKSSVDAASYFNGTSNHIRNCVLTKNSAYGYFWTDVFVERLNMDEYKIPKHNSNVYKFDSSGNFLAKYNTVKEAANASKSTERLILKSISEKTKSKGFYYSYDKNFTICSSTYNRLSNVYIYNLDGTFYKEFSSPRDCADFFGDVKTSRIYSAVRTGGLYKGYQISKERVPFMKSVKKFNEKRKVGQYSLDGVLIKEWDSIDSAFKQYGPGVKKCLKGLMNKTKGYVFKFIE